MDRANTRQKEVYGLDQHYKIPQLAIDFRYRYGRRWYPDRHIHLEFLFSQSFHAYRAIYYQPFRTACLKDIDGLFDPPYNSTAGNGLSVSMTTSSSLAFILFYYF